MTPKNRLNKETTGVISKIRRRIAYAYASSAIRSAPIVVKAAVARQRYRPSIGLVLAEKLNRTQPMVIVGGEQTRIPHAVVTRIKSQAVTKALLSLLEEATVGQHYP